MTTHIISSIEKGYGCITLNKKNIYIYIIGKIKMQKLNDLK